MSKALPKSNLQIRSTLGSDRTLTIELAEVPIVPPQDDQVLVRIEAVPINPSDLIPMLADADPGGARMEGTPQRPRTILTVSAEAANAAAPRIGQPLAVGLEGAGRVIAAGRNAQALLDRRVAVLSLTAGLFAQYCTVSMSECLPVPEDVQPHEAAGAICNPLTALAMVETLRMTEQRAVVHTAAASNLGQVLLRICQEDGIPLVNIVRKQEQVELLRSLGAEHVCNVSDASFGEGLHRALIATGATVAFDAIGGGDLQSTLLAAMERAVMERSGVYSPYGSSTDKRVYVYGRLDSAPMLMPKGNYGLRWAIEGWAMPPVLEQAGPQRVQALRERIANNLKTTFASRYGRTISLTQALQPEVMRAYSRQATGLKHLIDPWLEL